MEFKRHYHEMFTDYVARRNRLRRHRGRQNQQRQPGSDRTGTTVSVARQVGDLSKWVLKTHNTSELNTWVPLVRVPDVAQEQVAGQEAAPRARAVPVGRAAPEPRLAPAEEVLGGRAPVGPGPREQEPGSWEPERRARVVPVRSAAAVASAVSVSLGGLAVPIPAPAELDWSGAPSARGEEPPQGWVGSRVPARPAVPPRGSASRPSAGSPLAPRKDRGAVAARCWLVWAQTFHAVGRSPAVCRRAPVTAWVR